jgi:hypothetical protein
MRDIDLDDPDVREFLASIRDPAFDANQPACCCAVERDAGGRVLAHPPSDECVLHRHQVTP